MMTMKGRVHATILIIPVNLCMQPIEEAKNEGHQYHTHTN